MSKGPKQQGPSEQEKALKEVSVAQWNDYVARYQPAEAELMKRSELTEGEIAGVKGQVAGDVASSFEGVTRSTLAAGEQSGAGINSGKTKFGLAGNADARGEALGLGQVVAEVGAKGARDKQQAGITALGRGIAADATENMAAGARRATRVGMAQAVGRFERNSAAINAASAVAGAAAAKWGPELMEKWDTKKRLKKAGMDFNDNWDSNIADAELRSAFPAGTNPFGARNTDLYQGTKKYAFPHGYSPFTPGEL